MLATLLALCLSLLPMSALAAETTATTEGGLTVSGGEAGTDYTYQNNTLTVLTTTALTVSGETTKDKIVVSGGVTANLILDGVSITFNDGTANSGDKTEENAGTCALSLGEGSTLNLTLAGENTLQSGAGRAGIFVPQNSTLTIDGEGALNVTGGRLAAGIGGDLWHNAGTINIKNGSINATGGSDAAAIGGGHANDGLNQQYGGFASISITGGTVNAETTGNSAAIGTGCWWKEWKEGSCSISIHSAIVTASTTGDHQNCAAIGRGISNGNNTVSITIENSIVTATNAVGKGDSISSGGSNGVNINNSIVSVSAGSDHTGNPILSGSYTVLENQSLDIPAGSTLTLAEGTVLTNTGIIMNFGTITGDGSIQNDGTMYNIGEGKIDITLTGTPIEDATAIKYLDESGEEQSVKDYTLLTSDTDSWNDGWYVALGLVNIPSRVTVTGDVHLILADGYTLNATKGITVTGSNSLTIYGQSGGTGKLTAKGDQLQAGIGGNSGQSGGAITINGGTVNATGGNWAAGIGGGYNGAGGTITINGGTVTAEGVGNRLGGGAGIGGGIYGTGGAITINDGTVNATGGYDSAGIGGGSYGAGGNQIVINGGTVNATSGQGSGVALGAGRDKEGGKVTINGGTVYANKSTSGGGDGIGYKVQLVSETGSSGIIVAQAVSGDADLSRFNGIIKQGSTYTVYGSANLETALEIKKGETLKIENKKTLTISENVTLTNNGTITVSGTLTNNGTIVDNGTINGTVSGDVRYPSRVTVSLTQGGQSVASVSYGSTVTITATMQRAQTNGINAIAELGYVNFYLGGTDGTLLGSVNVTTGSNGAYTAALTLNDNIWAKGFNIGSNTITADFGGVAGTSSDGLLNSTGTATLTVTKASQTAPDTPTMSSRTTNSVTLNAISGGQGTVQYGYVKGNSGTPSSWQNGTTFSGLQPGTDYTFYARYAGNDYYNESPVSAGLTFTTLPEITASNLDAGYVGVPYNATLQATVDSGKTVTWTLASGSTLPAGLTLNNNGTISGTPKAAVTNYTFTVQATIDGGDGTQQVTNTATLSITINQGTAVITANPSNGNGIYTYGETITISGEITASNQAPSNGINSIAEPEQNQVGLYLGDTQLAMAEVTNGSFTITYDTAKQGISIGGHGLTVKYGGSDDLNSGSTTVTITLNAKPVTATVTNTITKVYDGDTDADVELAVASSDLVNADDEIAVTGTGTYSGADAGESIDVTVSNIQTDGDDSAWYTVSAPTGVTGAITQATQAAPNAPTVIERTSSSVTLAALGTTGQGDLEYGYTTDVEVEPDHWQTVTTFTGLTPGTTYTFYARYAGSNNYHPAVSKLGTETSTLSNTDPNDINPGETVITEDGTKVTNDGEKITITPGDGGTTITITPDDGTTVNGDGTVNVPGGSTIQTGDGPEMTLPDGGTVDPDTGAVTPDEGGSVTIGSGDDTTTITPPSGQPVTPNDDGSVALPGGSTVTGSDGERVTIPPEGGTLQPGGEVEYTVTVTFDSQGGSQVPSQDITVGEFVSQPDDPTRTGYRFLGWYTAATGGARWDFTQPVTGDQTLYAQWAYLPPANPNYKITIGDTENGTVTVNPTAAKEGTTVTITPVPDAGYQVGTVSVTDRFGQAVAVDQQADGTYTFVMPDGQVTVEVTFLQGEAPDLPFSDVTESDWFYDAVTYAYENGLMDGVGMGLFAPNSETTRAQLVTILYRLAGQPAPGGDSGFSDVETGTWYTDAVAWAAQNGIVNGVSDTQFAPGDDITREQLAVILYRYATYQGYDVSQRADLSGFVDAGTISTYAQEALSWASAQGLVLGFEDDSLRPQGNASRAQIAAVLMRFCQTVAE